MIEKVTSKRGRIVFSLLLFAVAFSVCFLARDSAFAQRKRTARSRTQKPKTPPKPKIDYANFSHQTHVVTEKLACSSCHKVPSKNWKDVRKGDAAFQDVADFPEPASCLNCHRTQFFARERPAPVICSNCHIAITPRDTARWLFPSLGDLTDPKLKRREFVSEFGVDFPHDKHVDLVASNLIPFRGGLPDRKHNQKPKLRRSRMLVRMASAHRSLLRSFILDSYSGF